MRSTISVVMATYNGERYLFEQMESLRNQTVMAEEVIIMDDGSTDGTVKLVKDYICRHDLVCWRLVENERNQGWMKNFERGFRLAKGDYIFPCDQDDVWHLDKCEIMVRIMEEHPELDLLASNYTVLFSENDTGSRAYVKRQRGMKNDGSLEVPGIDPKWAYIMRPGCTYCFRKSFFDDIADRWESRYAHDAILWRYARMRHSMGLLDHSTMDFRRHGDNVTSGEKRKKEDRLQTFDAYIHFHEIASGIVTDGKEIEVIKKGIAFLKERKHFLETGDLLTWSRLLLKYRQYYLSLSGWMGDLYFVIRG